MSTDHFARLKEVVITALGLQEQERAAYLESIDREDRSLRREAEGLLAMEADIPAAVRTGGMERIVATLMEQAAGNPVAAGEAETNPVPTKIGSYRIVRLIARGGMGEVFEAEQATPVRRRVAIKIIRAGMDTAAVLARFSAERQALALMSHPYIAAIHDAGATSDGSPYVVMEYVDGVPLTEYVESHRLDLDARLDLFLQVCGAVSHAHQKGIIHRDLKPSNILVTQVDGKAAPKVIDFGIAKATQQPLTTRTLETSLGQLIGTPEYMSPEQAAGTGLDVDTRADVYALGVLLYEVLSGEHPLPREVMRKAGLEEMLRLIREHDPVRPSARVSTPGAEPDGTLSRRLSGDLDWIALRALEKDRDRRYDSVLDLSEDIRRHRRHEPVAAGPPSQVYRLKKFLRRNRLTVGFGMVLAVVLLASAAGVTWQGRDAVIQRRRAEAASDHARQESDRAQRINAFLQDMLAAADPGEMGKDVTVRQVLDQAAKTLNTGLATDSQSRADAHHTLGVTYTSLSLLAEGRRHLEQALALRRELDGPDDESIAGELLALSECILAVGDQMEARRLALEGLRMQRRLAQEPDHLIGELLGQLARVELRLGSYDDAERLARSAVHQLEALAPAHERLLGGTLVTLAEVLWERQESLDGEAMARRALEIHERLLGQDHPVTLDNMNTLAVLLGGLGPDRIDEHESLLTAVVERSRRLHGDDHLEVAAASNNYSVFLMMKRGRLVEARLHQLEALRIWRQVYKGGHSHIVTSLNNLGYLSWNLGEPERSEEFYREAIAMGVELGDEASVMQARTNLALALHYRGQHADALALGETIWPYHESKLEPASVGMLWLRMNKGCLLIHLGKLEEGEDLLNMATEIFQERAARGIDHPGARIYHRHLLGQLRGLQGRWPEAESMLREPLEIMRTWRVSFGLRRHAYRHAEAISRAAGHAELADAHGKALMELEASLEPAHEDAPEPGEGS